MLISKDVFKNKVLNCIKVFWEKNWQPKAYLFFFYNFFNLEIILDLWKSCKNSGVPIYPFFIFPLMSPSYITIQHLYQNWEINPRTVMLTKVQNLFRFHQFFQLLVFFPCALFLPWSLFAFNDLEVCLCFEFFLFILKITVGQKDFPKGDDSCWF